MKSEVVDSLSETKNVFFARKKSLSKLIIKMLVNDFSLKIDAFYDDINFCCTKNCHRQKKKKVMSIY